MLDLLILKQRSSVSFEIGEELGQEGLLKEALVKSLVVGYILSPEVLLAHLLDGQVELVYLEFLLLGDRMLGFLFELQAVEPELKYLYREVNFLSLVALKDAEQKLTKHYVCVR